MGHQFNNDHLATIEVWEKQFPGKFTADQGNVDLIVGYIRNKLGGILSVTNLNTAARACHAALKFVPGHEPPDPRAPEKAQAQKDIDELTRKRKREAEIKAGIGPNQGKVKTEFDRVVEDKPRVSEAEIRAAAKRDLDLQQYLSEVDHLIQNHKDHNGNHAKTFKQLDQMRHKRDELVAQKASGERILKVIEQLQESFDDRSIR